jgi:hypothetical protein
LGYAINGIKNYTVFVNEGEFELVLNEETDFVRKNWTVDFCRGISKYMKELGLYDVWNKLLPRDIDFPLWERLEDRHIDWIKNLPDPTDCLCILEETNLMLKAKDDKDILYNLEWLKDKWEQGFYIYLSNLNN